MISSIGNLEKVESFWPWMFRIASSKIAQYYRGLKREASVQFGSLEDSLLEGILTDDTEEASTVTIRDELGHIVIEAVSKLKSRQRSIVALRCFEDMSFSEIAESVGCKEIDARVSFFRAKQYLRKHLSRRGLSRSSLLLALVLFGKMTTASKAAVGAVTVSPGVLTGIGISASVVGIIKSYFGRITAAAAAILICCVAGLFMLSDSVPNRADVRSVHFMFRDVKPVKGSGNSSSRSSSSSASSNNAAGHVYKSGALFETWLYFPEGPDGAFLRREQRWGKTGRTEQCSWLQDGSANYYYRHSEKMSPEKRRVYITNNPLGCMVLPTDPPELIDFILKMCKADPRLGYISDTGTGLITEKVDNRIDSMKYNTTYKYNRDKAEFFKPFWPADIKVIDNRDAMHKRGWTYFVVEGLLGQDKVSGEGRIPFSYSKYGEYRPWLCLRIGDKFSLVDVCGGAYILDQGGNVVACFSEGSFFKGLGRPWMGLRVYDTVRRDAARERIPFSSEQIETRGRVVLSRERGYSVVKLDYIIDMSKDVIHGVSLSATGGPMEMEGFLEFSYLDDVEDVGEEFAEPSVAAIGMSQSKLNGVLWLFDLAEDRLLN
jgi:RNA polymerase sigma factor (sigma-70 family)